MESRIRLLLLSAWAALACAGCATHRAHHPAPTAAAVPAGGVATAAGTDEDASADNTPPPVVVQPQVQRRTVSVPHIGARNVELGAYYGILSIENFGSQPVQGVKLDYHVTEDFFFQGAYGQARAGETSYELLSGGIQLLSSAERRFTYYDLSLGYNLLPGEIFIGHRLAMTSALYMIGGIGSVDFAGDQNFAVNFGAGFRVLPTDWLALHIDMQDIVFRTNIFSVYRLTNNLQATVGLSVFF